MHVAWCPKHRGVMRIAFFDPPPAHFGSPCPRCQGNMTKQIRNKYAMETPKEVDLKSTYNRKGDLESAYSDDDDLIAMLLERVSPAPKRHSLLCDCRRCIKGQE